MYRRGSARVMVAAGLGLLAGCGQKEPAQRNAVFDGGRWPNVVLISVDMLRPDHLGCYGYDRPTSPNIDRLAAEGALFEQAISTTSWTLPAHAALMTGLADSVHGCTDTNRRLSDERETLAERLFALGYETAGFFSGPYLHPVFGLAQGFEAYVDCTSYAQLNSETARKFGAVEGLAIWNASHRDITNPHTYAAVRDWLHRPRERPFFLFVHLWDVHYDFVPPPPYDRMFDPDYEGPVTGDNFLFDPWISATMPRPDLEHLIALYDGEIAWTDMHVGKILSDLATLGIADSTLVVLVADHGTEFFEHGSKSHRQTLFDEVIRVPAIMRMPGTVPAGARIDAQVSLIDIAPTILDLVERSAKSDIPNAVGGTDAEPALARGMMGQSLTPIFRGEPLRRDNLAVSELLSNERKLRSYRRPDRKLIVDLPAERRWAYDLSSDPGEANALFVRDRAGDPPAWLAAALQDAQLGVAWLQAARGGGLPAEALANTAAGSSHEIPAAVMKQLQSLGYVGGTEHARD